MPRVRPCARAALPGAGRGGARGAGERAQSAQRGRDAAQVVCKSQDAPWEFLDPDDPDGTKAETKAAEPPRRAEAGLRSPAIGVRL